MGHSVAYLCMSALISWAVCLLRVSCLFPNLLMPVVLAGISLFVNRGTWPDHLSVPLLILLPQPIKGKREVGTFRTPCPPCRKYTTGIQKHFIEQNYSLVGLLNQSWWYWCVMLGLYRCKWSLMRLEGGQDGQSGHVRRRGGRRRLGRGISNGPGMSEGCWVARPSGSAWLLFPSPCCKEKAQLSWFLWFLEL